MLLAHHRTGSGDEPVLFLHDFLGDHHNYDPLLPYLDTATYTFVRADLRGYGDSRHLVGSYTAREAATDVLALADALGWQSFHLVGHSMSSLVAQQATLLAPARINSMALVAPVGPAGAAAPPALRAALHRMIDDDEAARQGLAMMYGERLWPRWVDIKVRAWRTAATPAAAHGYLEMFTGTNLAAAVTGLKTPLLLVVGAHDHAYAAAATRTAFLPCYPHAELVVCDNAAHYPMQEAPVFLTSCLERFWQRLRAPTALARAG